MSTHADETQTKDLTVSEAARLARVSVDTIRRYTDDDTLPSYRTPKNARRIILADLVTVFPRISTPYGTPASTGPGLGAGVSHSSLTGLDPNLSS